MPKNTEINVTEDTGLVAPTLVRVPPESRFNTGSIFPDIWIPITKVVKSSYPCDRDSHTGDTATLHWDNAHVTSSHSTVG